MVSKNKWNREEMKYKRNEMIISFLHSLTIFSEGNELKNEKKNLELDFENNLSEKS